MYIDPTGYGQRGYISFGIEHAKNNDKGDLKEFWHVGREYFKDKNIQKSYAKNVWPESILPEFKDSVLNLYTSLDHFAETLLSSISEYLGLPKNTLPRIAQDGNTVLRALHYPPVSGEQFKSGAVRAAAHEDINLITILCEATESGLELLTRQGDWLEIECKPGQMIIDSGDMLSRITNEIIPSTTHRVVNPQGAKNKPRYSMLFLSMHMKCVNLIF